GCNGDDTWSHSGESGVGSSSALPLAAPNSPLPTPYSQLSMPPARIDRHRAHHLIQHVAVPRSLPLRNDEKHVQQMLVRELARHERHAFIDVRRWIDAAQRHGERLTATGSQALPRPDGAQIRAVVVDLAEKIVRRLVERDDAAPALQIGPAV